MANPLLPDIQPIQPPASEAAVPGADADKTPYLPSITTPATQMDDRWQSITNSAMQEQRYAGPGGMTNIDFDAPIPMEDTAFDTEGNLSHEPRRAMNAETQLVSGIASLPLAFADTIGQSVGLLSDTSVQDGLKKAGFKGYSDFYANRKQLLRAGADTVGMFIPGMFAVKGFELGRGAISAGRFGEALKDSTALGILLGNGERAAARMKSVKEAALYLNKTEGFLAGKNYKDRLVTLDSLGEGAVKMGSIRKSAIASATMDGVRKGLAFELGVYSTMSRSDFLYPTLNDEAPVDGVVPKEWMDFDTLKWAALGPVLGGAGEFAAARLAVRSAIQGVSRYVNPAADTAGVAAGILDATFRPGERGPGLTAYGIMNYSTKETIAQSASADLRQNLSSDLVSFGDTMFSQFGAAGRDRNVVLPKEYNVSLEQKKVLADVVTKNPTVVTGLSKFDALPEVPAAKFLENNAQRVAELSAEMASKKKTNTKIFKSLQKERDLREQAQFFVVENTGDVVPFSTRSPNWLDNHSLKDDIFHETPTPDDATMFAPKAGSYDRQIGVDSNFNIFVGVKPHVADVAEGAHSVGFETATRKDRSVGFALGTRAIQAWKPTGKMIHVHDEMPWFSLDAIADLARQKPEAVPFIQFSGKKIGTVSDLEFHVLDLKYQAFLKETAEVNKFGQYGRDANSPTSLYDIFDSLNLPTTVAGQQHPLVEVFQQLAVQGDKTLTSALQNGVVRKFYADRGLDYDDAEPMLKLQKLIAESVDFPEMKPYNDRNIPLFGNRFRQTDAKPVFMMSRPVDPISRTTTGILEKLQTQRAHQLDMLLQAGPQTGAPLTGNLARLILTSKAFKVSTDVHLLRDEVAAGQGVITQQGRVFEQDPVTKAFDTVMGVISGATAEYTKNVFKPFQSGIAEILDKKNTASLFQFNQAIHASRYGWDIAEVTADGSFRLHKNKTNQDLWRKLSQDNGWNMPDLPETPFMPNMAREALKKGYTALQVDPLASRNFSAVTALSHSVGQEGNYHRMMRGLEPIALRDYHVPVPNAQNKATVVIQNELGERINMFARDTKEEAMREAHAALAQYSKENPNRSLTIRTWDEVSRYNSVFESDYATKFINYADEANQTGAASRGGFFEPRIQTGPEMLDDLLNSIADSYIQLGRRTAALMYEPQFNYARQAHLANAAGASDKSRNYVSIWERYANGIFGRQTLRPDSVLGRLSGAAEAAYDDNLRGLFAKVLGPQKAEMTLGKTSERGASYAQLAKELTFDPFGSTEKYLRDTFQVKPEASLRATLSKANEITSLLTFRALDTGTMIMNYGSLLTTWAPVARGLKRLPGESLDTWIGRTGAWGSRISDSDMNFNWAKSAASTAHWYFTPEAKVVLDKASASGFFTPEAIAMHAAYSEPAKNLNAKKLDKFMSAATWMADNSEEQSRMMAFGMGYKIAKDLHKMEDENAFMFAHRVMSDMIGDYRAVNRPQMFQGTLGTALGMFQTYMLNYYRRLYTYVENKDYRTLAIQYASQQSIFGAAQTPGFDIYASTFASNYDGTSNPVDNFRSTFGEQAGDAWFYGSLSNIPKFIFGPEGGINLFTRGDTNLSAPPTPLTMQNTPIVRAATQAFQGTSAAINMFRSGGEYSNQQMLEILSRYGVNRAFKNTMELAAGVKTNNAGELVEEDTRTWLGLTARALGGTTMQTQKLNETSWRQKGTDQSQLELRNRMNQSFRAIARSGKMEVSDLQDMVGSYMRSGGDPQYFPMWLRTNLITATNTKFERQYQKLLKSGKGSEFTRFLAIMQPDLTEDD